MDKNIPDHTPIIVGQALAWLTKMGIAYRYVPNAQSWEFIYDGLYLLIANECEANELGIYAPMLITDSDDEEIQRMVYEWSLPVIENEFSSNCDFGYNGEGLCHGCQWLGIRGQKPHLTKKTFVEKLNEMHELQLKLHFILQCTYEFMFNPPPEVMNEILKDQHKTKDNDE